MGGQGVFQLSLELILFGYKREEIEFSFHGKFQSADKIGNINVITELSVPIRISGRQNKNCPRDKRLQVISYWTTACSENQLEISFNLRGTIVYLNSHSVSYTGKMDFSWFLSYQAKKKLNLVNIFNIAWMSFKLLKCVIKIVIWSS